MRSFRNHILAIAASLAILASASADPSIVRVEKIGLYAPPHVDPQGHTFNHGSYQTPGGDAFGMTQRFDGYDWSVWHNDGVSTRQIQLPGQPASNALFAITPDAKAIGITGNRAWLYDGQSTAEIGLMAGAPLTENRPHSINTAGQVLGTTTRYDTVTQLNSQQAWFFDGFKTVEIGLTGLGYTGSTGQVEATVIGRLNQAGQAIGYTARNGESPGGFAPWFFNGSTTVAVAPEGAEFQRSDGRQSGFVSALTESGHVVGSAERYNGSQSAGTAVWHHHNGTTSVVSPTTQEFTRADGVRNAQARGLNEAGQILGTATRYNGQAFSGRDSLGSGVWLSQGGSQKNLGLSGGKYTRADGYQNNSAHLLNESGTVVGESATFHSTGFSGQVTWLYNGASTAIISPTGAGFTDGNGRGFSQALMLNQANQAIGYALHFDPTQPAAAQRAGWFFDGQQTVTIALGDAIHRNSDGSFFSESRMLSEGGLVAGYSERYNHYFGGQTAWIWDSFATQGQELITFDFAVPGNNGYNHSEILFLNDAGFAFGYYTVRDEALRENTARAFGWFRDYGVFDLNTIIDAAWLAENDISYFDFVRDVQLLGNGELSILVGAQGDPFGRDAVRIHFALDDGAAVPEPSTYGLAAAFTLALATVLRKRIRKKQTARD